MTLSEYIEQHIDKEHPYLYKLWRDTNLQQVRGHMASGHLQGVVLRMLVGMIRPRRILEIGTYTGYSALSMASALDDGATIDTYEINDELEDFTRRNIELSPWADKVKLHIGDVLTELDNLLNYTTLSLLTATSGSTATTTTLRCAYSPPEAIFLPTTPCGTDTSSTPPTTMTHRHLEYAISTRKLPKTRK